jgi:alkylation response protein AidB-like acyl-CoA dehydrogenase
VVLETLGAANMGFALCPTLTVGAIEALVASWIAGTAGAVSAQARHRRMDRHDEPDRAAGRISDVGALRAKAEAAATEAGRSSGTKIFISFGDHDIADNIVHLVLARTPDAPREPGISLFLVPKYRLNADGSPGATSTMSASCRSSTRWACTARRPAC